MVTNYNLSYRTLEELIDSASVDLRNFYSDGVIEIAELIKVVQECNYDLGIQINQTKETILDIEHHHCRLPSDFQFLNFAMLCHQHTHISNLWPEGLVKEERIIEKPLLPQGTGANFASGCYCYHITTDRDVTLNVTDCNGVTANLPIAANLLTSGTSMCLQSINSVPNTVVVVKGGLCYTQNGQFSCTALTPVNDCSCDIQTEGCEVPDRDPWLQSNVRTICDGEVSIKIEQACGTQVRHYTHFEPLFLQPCRRASDFSSNDYFRVSGNIAIIRDNFLEVSRECSKVYLNYQGILEDNEGNLLVLDHPKINQFYEYAVKLRILENLYINGEADLERRLQLVEKRLLHYKQEAMNIAYMPDFKVIVETYRKIRRDENEKHFAPFSRFFGAQKLSAWFDRLVNGRYRE